MTQATFLLHEMLFLCLFVMYILVSRHVVADTYTEGPRMGELVDPNLHMKTARHNLVDKIIDSIKNYLSAKATVSLMNSSAATLLLFSFGVPMPLVFGVITFLCDWIPAIGALIAAVLPLPFMLLDPDIPLTHGFTCFFFLGFMQLLFGEVVEPMFVGDKCEIHPCVVMVGLMFFGFCWGLPGMILSTPILLCIKLAAREFNHPSGEYLAALIESLGDEEHKKLSITVAPEGRGESKSSKSDKAV